MKQSTNHCSKCGAEITNPKSKKCTECGAKIPKPIHKKWWFWVIIAIVCISFMSETGDDTETVDNETTLALEESSPSTSSKSPEITYEEIDLQTMLDDLKNNAMKAEKTYQNKYVTVTGKIKSFDSDGTYITIEPVISDAWNFETVMCYVKKEDQLDYLLTKSTGDTVTIKGKIISIGEYLGYSINIDEIK